MSKDEDNYDEIGRGYKDYSIRDAIDAFVKRGKKMGNTPLVNKKILNLGKTINKFGDNSLENCLPCQVKAMEGLANVVKQGDEGEECAVCDVGSFLLGDIQETFPNATDIIEIKRYIKTIKRKLGKRFSWTLSSLINMDSGAVYFKYKSSQRIIKLIFMGCREMSRKNYRQSVIYFNEAVILSTSINSTLANKINVVMLNIRKKTW